MLIDPNEFISRYLHAGVCVDVDIINQISKILLECRVYSKDYYEKQQELDKEVERVLWKRTLKF